MSATVLYMSMSLDGFIAGPNERIDNGLGDGGLRLHEWPLEGQVRRRVPRHRSRRLRPRDDRAGGPLGRRPPRRRPDLRPHRQTLESEWPLITYVDDVRTAMAKAKEAAGDRNVMVHGAGTAQLALAAGVLDELEIHLIPVLLGQGRRLFDHLSPEHIELERTRVLEEDGVTHLHYRVQR